MNPLPILALAALVTASASLSSLAALDCSRVLSGELWRVATGHLAHLSWRQYLTDAPAFAALSFSLQGKLGRGRVVALWILAALCVSLTVIGAGLHEVYGGLSGISCALTASLGVRLVLEEPRRPVPYLICGIFCLYLVRMEGLASGVPVAREAHLAGAAAGCLFSLFTRPAKHAPASAPQPRCARCS